MMEGYIVQIEGPDGVGKTTLANNLFDLYGERGVGAVYMKFPQENTEVGDLIRQMLKGKIPFNPIVMQSWQYADKLLAQKKIQVALDTKSLIILDRYIGSTACYGMADGINVKLIPSFLQGLTMPHQTIVLDGEPFGSEEPDIYESSIVYQMKVRTNYIAQAIGNKWDVIQIRDESGAKSEETIASIAEEMIRLGIDNRDKALAEFTAARAKAELEKVELEKAKELRK